MADERVGEKRHRSGRRPSPVWAFFTEIRTAENKVHARCNFCAKRCAGVASRMRSHVLGKCENAPTDIERLLDEAIANSATVRTVAPNTAVISIDTYPTSVVEPDNTTLPDTVMIQTSNATALVAAIDTAPSPLTKRQKQPQVQQVQAPIEKEIRPTVSQVVATTSESDDLEAEATTVDNVMVARVYHQQPLSSGYSEEEAARVHQKLVLACVLNDVPAAFVEDEALMEAFDLARRGLPRLSAEQAKTTVLQDLADKATKQMERELASCEVLTLVHRHFKKQGAGETGPLTQWCNRWIGLNEHRKVVPLKETFREMESSSMFATDEDCCRFCTSREEFDAVVSTYRLSLAPEAVFCLCCECPQVYQQLRLERQQALSAPIQDSDSVSGISAKMLLSTCLLCQSLVLRKELLNTFPAVIDLLNKAIFLGHSVSKIAPLRSQLENLLTSLSWDAVPRLVKRMVYLEGDIRRYQAKVSVPTDEVTSFWSKLRVVDKLLTPFNWMLALSEAKETTSAQYIVLWLWLLAVLASTTSPLLPEQDKAHFTATVMSLIGRNVASHELVCMLLDPRVAGTGLSISGKRRVKSLVVQVAEHVFPSEGFEIGGARSQLLTQLGDYVGKSGSFDDVVAWEMSAGRAPKLFWNDFVEDAPHLARVARAVISVSPRAQSATETLNPSLPTEEFAWEQTFAVRQLKFQAEKASSQGTNGVEQYHSLLFPPAPSAKGSVSDETLSVEVDKALRVNNTPRWSASDETEVEAIVTRQLSLMLRVDGDNEIEQTLSTPRAEARISTQTPGLSWFAFQSANDLKALEQVVKNFIPCPPATNII